MKRAGWSVLVTALCVIVAVVWWRYGSESQEPADAVASARAQPQSPAMGDDPEVTRREPESPPPQTTQPLIQSADYAAQLRAAPDYRDFTRALMPAARAGDHAAQFYIFRALDYCFVEYRAYVDRGSTRRTLDEALTWAATHWPYDAEAVRLIYTRCHTLVESDAKEFRRRGEWLRLASDGGYPIAQAMAAKRQHLEGVRTTDDVAARDGESLRLMSSAIRSRDPEVMWEIASSSHGFQVEGGDPDANYFSWMLAACQRGLDCSTQSEVVKMTCRLDPGCQPYETATDIFRRWRAGNFAELEARARWINEKMDAGDWQALGF